MQQVYWEVEYLNGNIITEDIISPIGDGGYHENIHQRKDIKYLSLVTLNIKYQIDLQNGKVCGVNIGTYYKGNIIQLSNQNVYYEPIQFKEAFFIDDGKTFNPQVFIKSFNIGWKANFNDFNAKVILSVNGNTFEPTIIVDEIN